jgi:hypothetical protein
MFFVVGGACMLVVRSGQHEEQKQACDYATRSSAAAVSATTTATTTTAGSLDDKMLHDISVESTTATADAIMYELAILLHDTDRDNVESAIGCKNGVPR